MNQSVRTPPSLPPIGSANASNGNSAVILAILITFVVTSFLWGAVLAAVVVYFTFVGGSGFEDPFHLTIEYPEEVRMAEEFEVTLTVENATDQSITLSSIDIFSELREGFDIIGTDPETTVSESNLTDDFTTLWLSEEFNVDSSTIVKIYMQAKKPGRWGGRIDVCDPSENFTSVYATLTVLPSDDLPANAVSPESQ